MRIIQDQSQQQLIQAKLATEKIHRNTGEWKGYAGNGNHGSKREPTGKDGSQPKQQGTALQIKNQTCFGMVKTNISFWSSLPSENSILIPFPIPAIINHLPLDTMWQPGSYQSISCHYLSDGRPSKPAAPEETLIREILMPGSPLDPAISKEGLSNSKKNLSLCFWVHYYPFLDFLGASHPEAKTWPFGSISDRVSLEQWGLMVLGWVPLLLQSLLLCPLLFPITFRAAES